MGELILFSKQLSEFLQVVGKLKAARRSGWVSQVDIEEPESVADHSFRCAIIAMCICNLTDVDVERLVPMLLLHDIQEAVTGDFDSLKKKELGIVRVEALEKAAIKNILSLLPIELRERYFLIWDEFKAQNTPEAILANDIDKIEMVLQALEYEEKGWDSSKLEVFWASAEREIKTPQMHDMFLILKEKRLCQQSCQSKRQR